ncbi:MAG: hypothetical protein VB877_02420, partial [Pirellulaceae bacterium]
MSFFRHLLSRKAAHKRKQRNRQHRRREFVNEIARQLNHEPLEERRLLTVNLGADTSLAENAGLATFSATTTLGTSHAPINVDLDFGGSAELGVDYLLKAQQIGTDIDGAAAADMVGISVDTNADGSVVAVGSAQHDGQKGHVRVYEYSSGSWTQLGLDIDGAAGLDQSGISVSLSDDGTKIA